MHKEVEQAYWHGFRTKCAEYGVDAEALVKLSRQGAGVLDAGRSKDGSQMTYTAPRESLGQAHSRLQPVGKLVHTAYQQNKNKGVQLAAK